MARFRFAPARPSIAPGEKPARSSITCAVTMSFSFAAAGRAAAFRSTDDGCCCGCCASPTVPARIERIVTRIFMLPHCANAEPEAGPWLCWGSMSSSVFALSIHADYRCRHSGACCTADWDVPVELPVYRSLAERLRNGSLRVAPHAEELPPFILEPDLPDDATAMLERTDRGECVFFERGSHLCVVHRDAGEA